MMSTSPPGYLRSEVLKLIKFASKSSAGSLVQPRSITGTFNVKFGPPNPVQTREEGLQKSFLRLIGQSKPTNRYSVVETLLPNNVLKFNYAGAEIGTHDLLTLV